MILRQGHWTEMQRWVVPVRRQVFVIEQRVPLFLEWDDADLVCHHVACLGTQYQAVACGRMTPQGHIGRIAVLPNARHQGLGTRLLHHLLAVARSQGLEQVDLDAQCHALDFYRALGFEAKGPVFDDAGIPHRHMERVLSGH